MKFNNDLDKKYKFLKGNIEKLRSVIVAFSGGADSSFLLYAAFSVLGKNNVLAVSANSPTYTKKELNSAKEFTEKLGIKHQTVNTDELKNSNFVKNPTDRCYFCKKELFFKLKKIAEKEGYKFIIDGQNFDDRNDFRPGSIAAKELGVRSPLKEAGFSKQDIRAISKKIGLSTWNKPALACLSSRFPYGNKITKSDLIKIQKAENFLYLLGFEEVRVRHYGKLCRIEVGKSQIKRIFQKEVCNKIVAKFKKLGYTYVTVDLEGYRAGSMNEIFRRKI